MSEKKGPNFSIIKNDPLDDHKGTNIGSVSLDNIAPIFIDVANKGAFIDIGDVHARAKIEKSVKWTIDKAVVEDDEAKEYWLCWVATECNERGPYYAGLITYYLLMDEATRRGYKSMPEHVNMTGKSMKHHITIDQIGDKSKAILKDFLMNHDEGMWKHSSDVLHQAFN